MRDTEKGKGWTRLYKGTLEKIKMLVEGQFYLWKETTEEIIHKDQKYC